MTLTTIVLSIFTESTMPSRVLRALPRASVAVAVSSGIAGVPLVGGELLGRFDLALAQHGGDPRHVLSHLADAGGVGELAGDVLEPQVEELLARVGQALDELGVAEVAQGGGLLRHQTSAS